MLVENAKIRIETHRQAAILYFAVWSVYSLYFHPLSRCPGPKLAAISPIIHILWDIRGKEHSVIKRLHDQYGSVVRIAPNALVYNSAAAWKDI
ncbi:Versicolorin B desaturase [Penicillium subrubescens]|jgi:hypothetical protein|uniref:Versicolorin B desaturase n=1 Tax=Penicillium subrubescens TaxID=1316194 RepID=A0A1Q5U848_9EURO|nr:Versicolorin B desaturase [Penicillium subrubescens]